MNAAEFAKLVPRAKRRADGVWWDGRCKAHDDRRSSLSFCDGDRAVIVKCHAGCVVERIAAAFGVEVGALFHENGSRHHVPGSHIVATYDYHDERGRLLYQVCRFEPKDFRQRRPDGQGGWTWRLDGVRRVVYRLHELAEVTRVWQPEGEKDTDALVALGLRATTTPGGADGWRDEYADQVKAAGVPEVMLLPDNDPAGEQYDAKAARAYLQRTIRVKLVRLPGLPPKGDVSDWLAAGGTVAALEALAEATPWLETAPEAPETPTTEPAAGPRITMTAEDGAFVWPDGAGVNFTRVVEGGRGVQAEITATWQGRVIGDGSLNLLSPRTRDGLAKKLERKAPDVPWEEYLDLACRQMVARLREGEPVEELQARPRVGEVSLIAPVLPERETTTLYAGGGSGKSLTALLWAIGARTGCALPSGLRVVHTVPAVLILNWETDRASPEARLHGLCCGLGITPPNGIYHRRMTGALVDDARRLRADVARLNIGLVIVDSLAPASGPEPETAGAVLPAMNFLGSLTGVTRLVVAHVSHANEASRDPKPYGSVFVWNMSRSCWYIQRSTEDRDELVLGLYHKKANDERLHDALSLRFSFTGGAITPHAATIDASPELLERDTIPRRLAAQLSKSGDQTVEALAYALGKTPDNVRRTLNRNKRLFVPREGTDPQTWGLRIHE